MTKRIILTADDFGYNPAVSQAIINLIKKRRLSATSCMTNMPGWDTLLPELLLYKKQCDIGLHFNLTEGELLSTKKTACDLKTLIIKSYLHQLKQETIELELQSQIEEFKSKTDFLPAYIDGHQHVQQLPIIRKALIKVINQYWPDKKPYVRISSNGLLKSLSTPKTLLLHLLGATKLQKLCEENNISFNTSFSGVYSLQANQDYQKLFTKFLSDVEDKGIIMCHPGLNFEYNQDPIYAARANEYKFFQSAAFMKTLDEGNTKLR